MCCTILQGIDVLPEGRSSFLRFVRFVWSRRWSSGTTIVIYSDHTKTKKSHIRRLQVGVLASDVANMQTVYNMSRVSEYKMKTIFGERVWTTVAYTQNPG